MTANLRDQPLHHFQLKWTDLSATYQTKNGLFGKSSSHIALHPCSGEVSSGSITAVLGPSGAGKSTLFNCITGQLTSDLTVTGQCFISAAGPLVSQLKKSRIAYVPQAAEFFTLFTVRETLIFASRLNNVGWTNKQHDAGMRSLMVSFDMEDKLDWQIRKLSGGQQKRLAIACELVSSPAAIVLDEPTSGLDADNAEKLISHLKLLVTCETTAMRPAVLLSIHVPSHDVFHCFAFIGPVSSFLIVWYHGRIYDRELRNTWYSRNSLFFSKLISESISRLFCLGACGLAIYHIAYESIEPWRVIVVMSAMYLASAFWENAAAAFTLLFGRKLGLVGVAIYLTALEFVEFSVADPFVFKENARSFATVLKELSVYNRAFRASLLALFGFGRCSSSLKSDLITLSMGENDGPREVFSPAWYTHNVTQEELIDALAIYEVDDSTVLSLFHFISSWISPLENVIHQQPSYILSFYKNYDSQLADHFLVLSVLFVTSCLVLFLIMRRPTISFITQA